MPDTPKTDSVTKSIGDAACDGTYGQVVPAYFCRELERENTRLREALKTEFTKNIELPRRPSLFELETFVSSQAYRIRDALLLEQPTDSPAKPAA